MEELNKKLAEWAGFRRATQEEYSRGSVPQDSDWWGYRYPGGHIKWYLPSFTQSLDACFKWLVPKLYECNLMLCGEGMDEDYWTAEVSTNLSSMTKEAWSKAPALALCKAIEKLIDGEKDA